MYAIRSYYEPPGPVGGEGTVVRLPNGHTSASCFDPTPSNEGLRWLDSRTRWGLGDRVLRRPWISTWRFPACRITSYNVCYTKLLRVSNEIPFFTGCPYPKPDAGALVFCSDPKYMDLLTEIGTDVIELTSYNFV